MTKEKNVAIVSGVAALVILVVAFMNSPMAQQVGPTPGAPQCPDGYNLQYNAEIGQWQCIAAAVPPGVTPTTPVPTQPGVPPGCPAGQVWSTVDGQCVISIPTSVFGYLRKYEDKAILASEPVYTTTVAPLEGYLFKDVEPPGAIKDDSDANGKWELTVTPGARYFWPWAIDIGAVETTDRYPEESHINIPDYTISAKGQQPVWTSSELDFELRLASEFDTLIEAVTNEVSTSGNTTTWNLVDNSTAAAASTVYWLKTATDKVLRLAPTTTEKYLKDVIVKVVNVPEAVADDLKDFSFSVRANPGNLQMEMHDVSSSIETDFVLFYGYIEARFPIELDLMLQTDSTFTAVEGDDLVKLRVDDMRDANFVGEWKDNFNIQKSIIIEA